MIRNLVEAFPRRHSRLRAIILVWAVASALTTVARAEEPAPRTREQLLPPIAFAPASNALSYGVEAGGLGRLCSSGSGYFVAPLHLDDKAVIERITAFFEDSSRDGLGVMSLVRRSERSFEVLATTPASTGTDEVESVSTTAIRAPVVDNQQGAYVLQVVLTGPGVCLHGARVTYRTP
jgi:hypothetical protein